MPESWPGYPALGLGQQVLLTYTDSVLGRQDHQAVPLGTGLWDPEDGQTGLESARSEEECPHPSPPRWGQGLPGVLPSAWRTF